MVKNVGTAERIGRAGLGVILALMGIFTHGAAMLILLGVAALLIVTAAIGTCPFHLALGISTLDNSIQRSAKSAPMI